ncbi:MAG: GNAT family N-acetyltransferase [Bacillota bacterium]
MQKVEQISILGDFIAQDKIAHINTIGVMKICDDYSLYVDDFDQPQGYLIRRDEWNIIYYNSSRAEAEVIKMAVEKPRKFSGVHRRFYEKVKEKREIDFYELCYLYYLLPDDFKYQEPDHEVDYLTKDDAEIVDHHYTYQSEDDTSYDYIKKAIQERPSAVVRDEEGNPLSWAILRDDGSMGIAYTREEYRRRGLAEAVNMELLKRTIDFGLIPYVHIVKDNRASLSLADELGFIRYGEVVWFATS